MFLSGLWGFDRERAPLGYLSEESLVEITCRVRATELAVAKPPASQGSRSLLPRRVL